ncbi:MAG: oxidoreductase [Marivirga sp.]|nr:oxidoreductase [Marivirga sp.]
MEKIRWGILGCGKIANKFASDLHLVKDASLMAVASRDGNKASEFAKQHSAQLAFASYEALVTCEEVDVIYVATPHGFHHEHTLLCLKHKKAVLCEKALALNSRQVKEMIDTARSQQVFLMEAFWTKFIPQYQKVIEIIQSGEIGDLKLVQADFGFRAIEPTPQRFYDPQLGGGSLLDIGIYPVFLAVSLFGRPEEVNAVMNPFPSGVDEQISMSMKFNRGELAILSSTFAADTPVEATIVGTKGYIRMNNRFHSPVSTLQIIKDKMAPLTIEVLREDGSGYQFEARHVSQCLRDGLIESPVMSHADSILLMETLDRIREKCGIKYAVDN